MSGHSKWHNIQHKKGAADAARSGLFTKLAREITMAAKLGDKNPDNNPRLRLAILTARKNSMPNDNIKRAIEKASGANTESYEAVRYEGYGPGAVPVIVEALTDNPRRTVPEIRNIFGKNGGNMGEEGSVVFMFTRAGQIMYPASIGKTEDEMMEIIMEANADNLETSEEGFIITTKPEDFVNAQKYLADVLGEPEQAELTWLPNMPMDLDDEAYAKLEKLVDALDANDDVQKVFTAAA
ncbi:MAG: YebC/PmpR family DNA-binding transcriptional regulator [Alphaproteobacteria bacterium]|jgi:YebC/PmpR family DNA-binding regulatory protein|nr:YebC/PmpR family DNA-binding transcriptional regulator [Alphaproteobacteria bacterium]MEE1030450.1 YebC/PmpR family DNA-binding transcriptional regulator [Alphaproteobacteria bacterium]